MVKLSQSVKWEKTADIIKTNNSIKLSQKGKLLSDAVASDLFIV